MQVQGKQEHRVTGSRWEPVSVRREKCCVRVGEIVEDSVKGQLVHYIERGH